MPPVPAFRRYAPVLPVLGTHPVYVPTARTPAPSSDGVPITAHASPRCQMYAPLAGLTRRTQPPKRAPPVVVAFAPAETAPGLPFQTPEGMDQPGPPAAAPRPCRHAGLARGVA